MKKQSLVERKMMQADWSRTSQKTGNVTFTACSSEGKPILLKLVNARIAFEPSVYGGDGTELRKSICFTQVQDEAMANVKAMAAQPGFTQAIREQRATLPQMVALFPESIRVEKQKGHIVLFLQEGVPQPRAGTLDAFAG